jgi:predicted transcriptional regulator
MAQLIISLAEQHPDWTEQRIAQECGVKNQGRVSEVLAGYRGRST